MTHRQYVNLCVGHHDKLLREDSFNRDLLYYTIKGWADPKKFKVSKEKFWPLVKKDIEIQEVPTWDQMLEIDKEFRQLGGKKWLE